MERVAGFEPASSAWKAEVLPLNDTRIGGDVISVFYISFDRRSYTDFAIN